MSVLNILDLHIHFHRLFVDGVYVIGQDALSFLPVKPPEPGRLIQQISQGVGRFWPRLGENSPNFIADGTGFHIGNKGASDEILIAHIGIR